MRTPDGHLSALGKVFVGVVSLLIVQVVALVAVAVGIAVTLDQSRQNMNHIDCIVASGLPTPPEPCADIIQGLREDGILRPPPTVASNP